MSDPLRSLARLGLTFNAPLSEQRAAALVQRLVVAPGGHVLDLGCGSAELLLRIVAAHPGTTGTGVDLDRAALDRGRSRAAQLGLLDRVDLVEADVIAFRDRADVVLCVGAEHAWGGATPALAALAGHVEPGGLALVGAGFWAAEPGDGLRGAFGDLPGGLDELTTLAGAAGFEALDASAATAEEWDAFETAWRGGLERAAAPGALELAAARRVEYEEGYRGVLGFGYLVLHAA